MSVNLDPLRAELNAAAAAIGYVDSAEAGRPWALFGSAVMLFYGLRDRIGDVDVFVAPALWTVLAHRPGWERHTPDPDDPPYLERVVAGLHVHAFYAWTLKDPEVDADQCRRCAVDWCGWHLTPLELIRLHKAMARKHGDSPPHRKHRADLATIDAYLEAAA